MALKVHMIGNAHIDPVWMWTWPAGVDEAVNTCRTACDLLDEYPELVITRGEGWVHEQVRRIAPELFARIKTYTDEGRWGVVNGWWVQPDVNIPTPISYLKQGEIGKGWFQEHLGVDVTVGYQVDSFGHNAMMPSFLRQCGFKYYTFARPEAVKWPLPAELCRWQAPDGAEVIIQRIPFSYCARGLDTLERNLKQGIAIANREIGHAVCFYGIGDHGGGPSRQQIEWILAHREYGDGVELVFSHPQAFFDAVAPHASELPVYTGEFQFCSPGSYSVLHRFKQHMRRAELLLERAEGLVKRFPADVPEDADSQLVPAWKDVLFNQFHDTLAGTSIEPAYRHGRDELGRAAAAGRELIVDIIRRRTFSLGPCEQQRLVFHNTGPESFEGLVAAEPWLGAESGRIPVRLTDADGKDLIYQRIAGHAAEQKMFQYLIPVKLGPFGRTIVKVHHDSQPAEAPSPFSFRDGQIDNGRVQIKLTDEGIGSIIADGRELLSKPGIQLTVQEDHSNTWGSGGNAPFFDDEHKGVFKLQEDWRVLESGPLRMTVSGELSFENSLLIWKISLHKDDPVVRFDLRLLYRGTFEIIKMVTVPAGEPDIRVDGIPANEIERPMSGAEYPVQNHLRLMRDGLGLALASRDAYSADVEPEGAIRLTLLRSPNFVHNGNFKDREPDYHLYPLTAQGDHCYRISLMGVDENAPNMIAREVYRLSDPVWMSETTHGMPPRNHEGKQFAEDKKNWEKKK